MEYYNQVTSEYLFALKQQRCHHKFKLELLSANENVIGEIIRDVSLSTEGQVTINYGTITRRACTLTVMNTDRRYTPNQNSFFWVNRKFKLWLGIAYKENTYWFAQGVFYATDVSSDGNSITINGVDKGGALDGTLKLNAVDGQYIIETGSNIFNVVTSLLSENMGVSMVDPVEPIVDTYFKNQVVQEEISISENEYIGDLLTKLAESYGADVYYDVNGRLNFVRLADCDLINGYDRIPTQYRFDDSTARYLNSTISCQYDFVNAVTVFTNINATDSDGNAIENVSYTAYNKNPMSPINIYSIDIRRLESVETQYINGLTKEQMLKRCKSHADYLLLKSSMVKLSVDFTCITVPHLDVNQIVIISDKAKQIEDERFVIQSISMPLSASATTIQAVSLTSLPADTNIEMG